MNATLVETLLDCLLGDWSCGTVKEYVVGELANLVRGLLGRSFSALINPSGACRIQSDFSTHNADAKAMCNVGPAGM